MRVCVSVCVCVLSGKSVLKIKQNLKYRQQYRNAIFLNNFALLFYVLSKYIFSLNICTIKQNNILRIYIYIYIQYLTKVSTPLTFQQKGQYCKN